MYVCMKYKYPWKLSESGAFCVFREEFRIFSHLWMCDGFENCLYLGYLYLSVY